MRHFDLAAPRWAMLPALALACSSFVGAQPALAQNTEQLLNSTLTAQGQTDSSSQQSQAAVSSLANERGELFADYRVALQQLDRLTIYNANLQALVADQDQEKASMTAQLTDFGDMEKGIVPLMFDMITALEAFVQLDMPFATNERADRVQHLQDNMSRADLTVSEKYRQIMEAYEIETGYGRTIEAYTGTLSIEGEDRKVDMLRVGRILLAYQTPDQAHTGFWDKTSNNWAALGNEYRRSIADGLRIARKQAAPSLLEIPVPAAENAQ